MDNLKRCPWAMTEKMIDYHDNEWGVPVHDDRALFEMLVLESMQAGLSWNTVLNKREHFRQVFDNFEPKLVAQYNQKKYEELMGDAGIIRNKLKINAAINNASCVLEIQKEYGSFDRFIWAYVDFSPIVNDRKELEDTPAKTELSDRISKDLKKRGFKFVGSTIIYAFMQAVGMVDDHLQDCFRKTKTAIR